MRWYPRCSMVVVVVEHIVHEMLDLGTVAVAVVVADIGWDTFDQGRLVLVVAAPKAAAAVAAGEVHHSDSPMRYST